MKVLKKSFLLVCVLLLSIVAFSSCSKDDEERDGNSHIQVNDETWNVTSIPYFVHAEDFADGNYAFGFFGYLGNEFELDNDRMIEFAYQSSEEPSKGEDLSKKSLFKATRTYSYRQFIYKYKTGSATVTAVNGKSVTISFDNLVVSCDASSLPSYVSKSMSINGTLKFDREEK